MEVAAVQETLDREDMEVLLAALEAGGLALSNGYPSRPTEAAPNPQVKLHDFRLQEQIGKAQLEAIGALHERFARALASSLSEHLRTTIHASVSSVEIAGWGDFAASIPRPVLLSLLRAEGLILPVAIQIGAPLLYPMIDRLMGGSGADPFIPQRPLSQIELRVFSRITNCCAAHLSDAWSLREHLRLSAVEAMPNPRQVMSTHERVVVLRLEMRMDKQVGAIAVSIPSAIAEALPAGSRDAGGEPARSLIEGRLARARVDLHAVLARTTITLSELLKLRRGDVLTTEKSVSSPVGVQLEGQTKFRGSIGLFRGKKAIRIVGKCN